MGRSNTTSRKNSSFFFACAIAAVVFMASFTPIIPNILQPAAAVALPTGEWEIHENGYIGTLRIDSVDAQGVVTGTLEVAPDPSHTITGLYNERTGTLTFYRIINQQDPSSIQTYVGIVFRDGSPFEGTPDRLAGYFIGLPAGGGNRDQNVWGWYATLTSPAGQEAEPSEQAEEETLPNATDTTDTGPSPGIIGPDIGTATQPPAQGTNTTQTTEPDDTGGERVEEGVYGHPDPRIRLGLGPETGNDTLTAIPLSQEGTPTTTAEQSNSNRTPPAQGTNTTQTTEPDDTGEAVEEEGGGFFGQQ